MTNDVGNLGPGTAQAQKYDRVNPVNGILTLHLLIMGPPIAKHI